MYVCVYNKPHNHISIMAPEITGTIAFQHLDQTNNIQTTRGRIIIVALTLAHPRQVRRWSTHEWWIPFTLGQ